MLMYHEGMIGIAAALSATSWLVLDAARQDSISSGTCP
jgi:hypothetical protein